jgi:hypothetical protein
MPTSKLAGIVLLHAAFGCARLPVLFFTCAAMQRIGQQAHDRMAEVAEAVV